MKTYTVQPGETLGKIAERFYGDESRYLEIVAANAIEDPNRVGVGTELLIPGLEEDIAQNPQVAPVTTGSTGSAGRLTAVQLQEIMPKASKENINKYLPALNRQLPKFEIVTPLRQAHFIAQVAHESGSLRYSSENLNYSAKALRAVFGKYFTTDAMAEEYARKPEKIANRVYANRMDNGDEESGDGWKFRGRGLIQLTGRANYRKCSRAIGIDLEETPDMVADDPDVSVAAVCWFWLSNNLNQHADRDDVKKITRIINGGYHGLEDRTDFLEKAKAVLL
jgi:putative chitinase